MNGRDFPEHWEVVTLSNQRLFSFENGIWKGKKAPLEECAVVRNTNFTSDGYLDLADVAVLHIEQRHLAKKNLKWGDIIIERSGGGPKQPVGRVVFFDLNDGKYCFSNFTSRLRVVDKNKAYPFYLFFYLLYFYHSGQTRKLQRRTTGIRNLSFEDYKDARIPLPPLPEQRAITHILQTIQEAKSTRQREVELERECKAALLDRLFSHGTKGEPRKETEIGEIPESWEVVRLEEATEIIMGQSPKGDTYNTDGEGEPLINGPAEFGSEYPTPVQWTSKPTKLCQDGDILFCVRGNTTGRMNIANRRYCIGRGIAAIRERSSKSDTLFIRNLLEFEHSSLYRIAIGGGSTFPNITTVHLKNYLIPLPNVSEQQEIAEILQACHTKIAALEQETALLDELFHAMLDELMIGNRSAVPLIDREE